MIICPHSGLGNQIGNYVFGQYLLKRGIDVKYLITHDENFDRAFLLDKFNVNLDLAGADDIRKFLADRVSVYMYKVLLKNVLLRRKYYFNSFFKVLNRIRTEYGIFPKKDLNLLSKIVSYRDVLDGKIVDGAVCDCYSPIEEFEETEFKREIRKQLVLKEEFEDDWDKFLKDKIMTAKNPVGVHIRLGDYISLKIPVVKKEFLEKNMKFIAQNLDGVEFFIFTDDIERAKTIIPKEFKVYFSKNDENGAHRDFVLFNSCRHRIYSASSFSKWVKYLNIFENSIGFMPENDDLEIL